MKRNGGVVKSDNQDDFFDVLKKDGQKYCDACSAPVQDEKGYEMVLWLFVGLIVLPAGLLFYVIKKDYAPRAAKATFIGFVVAVTLYLLWYVGPFAIGMIVNIG